MFDDDSGYDLRDPKHPTYAERMFDAADDQRKRDRESGQCGHDGWVAGCASCERNERAARKAMGDA